MPRTPVAVVTADLHLQDRAWAGRPGLSGDAYAAFEFVCGLAVRDGLALVVAGDLLDRPRNESGPLSVLVRQLDRLCRAACPFLYVQGQPLHDRQDPPWPSAVHHWPRHLEQATCGFGPLVFAGLDWAPADEVPGRLEAVRALPACDVLVMHQVCREFMGDLLDHESGSAAGRDRRAELDWGQVPVARLLVVGDYHRDHVRLERTGADGQALSVLCPGSTCLQAVDEPPAKGCFVLHDDLSTESVEIPGRHVLRPPPLYLPDDLDAFCASCPGHLARARDASSALPEALRTPVLVVAFRSDLPRAHARIRAAAGEGAHLFLKEIRPPGRAWSADADGLDAGRPAHAGLVGSLGRFAEPGSREHALAERLLHAAGAGAAAVASELARARAEYLDTRPEDPA